MPAAPPKHAVFSTGLWRLRDDVSTLLAGDVVLPLPHRKFDTCVGWGRKPSFGRALRAAKRRALPLITLEDGFLAGYANGLHEPRHSYVVDRSGIYFDTGHPNDLEQLIRTVDAKVEDLDWAKAMMKRLAEERITKFNNWPDATVEDAQALKRPYLLMVDQVPGDASLAGAGADEHRFREMVQEAADHLAGRKLLVRSHPSAAARSPLLAAARELGIAFDIAPPVNPWDVMQQADEIWTISSQMGFEALLAGKPVHCFGRAFFAGRGLTTDHFSDPALPACALEKLFLVFYRHYMRCLDLHTRRPCSFDHALEQALCVRKQRERNTSRFHTGGLSPWKRKAVAPFLIGKHGRAVNHFTIAGAEKAALNDGAMEARWGARGGNSLVPRVLIEDGFVRSSGLGVALVLPCSLALDHRGPHFDCSKPSDLEVMLQSRDFSAQELQRASALRIRLVALGVTKYNAGKVAALPKVEEGRLKILVPGQVEADASIRFGSPDIRTNKALVAAVRQLYPHAFIAYKVHPDVVSGLRSGGEMPDLHDHLTADGAIQDWIFWSDRVETMTSLTGFEALLRGRIVGVHGMPAYAGWGLTDDRMTIGRRSRRRSLDELTAAMLLAYPHYIHPHSRLPCSPEELVEALAIFKPPPASLADGVATRINAIAIKLRDRKT